MLLVPVIYFKFLVLANLAPFDFGTWCIVLVLAKSVHIEVGPSNIHFSPYFEGHGSNIIHITCTYSNMNEFRNY